MNQPDDTALISAALTARSLAYTPYSNFNVGAAVLTASGRIFSGGNIENASYPMTLCAERVALVSAYAAGERTIQALAVVTPTLDVASPCGACRQVIFELAPHARIILLNLNGAVRYTTPAELLPHGFGPTQLTEGEDSTS